MLCDEEGQWAGSGWALCYLQVLPLYKEALSLMPEGLGQGKCTLCQPCLLWFKWRVFMQW